MDIEKIQTALKMRRIELEGTLNAIVAALAALGSSKTVGRKRSPRKRQLSAAARQRIVDAQKARWAAYRKKRHQ